MNVYIIIILCIYICNTVSRVCACRQSIGAQGVKEMQLLQERADNLEKKVLKYEQENQQLRSELDTLVACTRVCSNACVHTIRMLCN